MKIVRSLIFGWSPIKIQDYITSELMRFGVPEDLARPVVKILADAGYLRTDQKLPPLQLTEEYMVTKDKPSQANWLPPIEVTLPVIEATCALKLTNEKAKLQRDRQHFMRLAANQASSDE